MSLKIIQFNAKYLKENLLTNKALILLSILILPVITIPYLFISGNINGIYYLDIDHIGMLASIGMIIIPVALVQILFKFLFKKKENDFIMSLPLNRNKLFWSNYFAGIVLMALMLLITSVEMFLISLLHPHLATTISACVLYFVYYLIGYIFVYTMSLLSASICGNRLTHLLLSIALTYLFGFVHYVFIQSSYQTTTLLNAMVNNNGVLFKQANATVTSIITSTPTAIILYGAQINLWQIVTTIIETIIVLVIGYICFKQRKMELVGFSFMRIREKEFARIVIFFIPVFILVSSLIHKLDFTYIVFLMLLFAIYYLYDILTNNNTLKFRRSLLTFTILLIFTIVYSYLNTGLAYLFHQGTIALKDVKSIKVKQVTRFDQDNADIEIDDPQFITLFFDQANLLTTADSTVQLTKYITFNTTEGNYSYYLDNNLVLNEAIADYLSNDVNCINTINVIPFNTDNIVGASYNNYQLSPTQISQAFTYLFNEKPESSLVYQYLSQRSNYCLENVDEGYCIYQKNHREQKLNIQVYEYGAISNYSIPLVNTDLALYLMSLTNINDIMPTTTESFTITFYDEHILRYQFNKEYIDSGVFDNIIDEFNQITLNNEQLELSGLKELIEISDGNRINIVIGDNNEIKLFVQKYENEAKKTWEQ